jgi:hypothetical protein
MQVQKVFVLASMRKEWFLLTMLYPVIASFSIIAGTFPTRFVPTDKRFCHIALPVP